MATIPLIGLSGLQNQPNTASGFIGGLGAAADIRTANANADLATANADKAKAEGRMKRLSIANNLLRSISAAPEDQRAGRLEQGKAAIARMYPDIGDLSWLTLDNMDAVQGALTDTTQQFEEMIARGEFDLKTRDTENAIYNRDRKVTSDINVNGAQIANYRSQIGDRDRTFAAGRYDADRDYGLAYDKAIATGYGTVPAGAMMNPDGSVKVHIDPESGLPLSSDIAKSRVTRAGQVPQGYEYRPGDGSILKLTDTEGRSVAGDGEAKEYRDMPQQLVTKEMEDVEAADVARGISNDALQLAKRVRSGEIDPGFWTGVRAGVARNTGLGANDESNAYEVLDRFKTKFINESLRLNKGVQTEGDAERAANELRYARDPESVAQALEELARINIRAAERREKLIQQRRESYGGRPYVGLGGKGAESVYDTPGGASGGGGASGDGGRIPIPEGLDNEPGDKVRGPDGRTYIVRDGYLEPLDG